jgi:hypothetical protein
MRQREYTPRAGAALALARFHCGISGPQLAVGGELQLLSPNLAAGSPHKGPSYAVLFR